MYSICCRRHLAGAEQRDAKYFTRPGRNPKRRFCYKTPKVDHFSEKRITPTPAPIVMEARSRRSALNQCGPGRTIVWISPPMAPPAAPPTVPPAKRGATLCHCALPMHMAKTQNNPANRPKNAPADPLSTRFISPSQGGGKSRGRVATIPRLRTFAPADNRGRGRGLTASAEQP